jgi:hypothetical protein
MEIGASETFALAARVVCGEQVSKKMRIRAMEVMAMTGRFIEDSFLELTSSIITGEG